MTQGITIQFWNDLICPICPIGQVMLKRGIAMFPHRDRVQIVYRSSRLRPGVATHTVDTYLKGKYGTDADIPSILKQVERMGAQAGLVYNMAATLAGDTMDAHRLVHLAQSQGLQTRAVERIHKAHFEENASIFDPDVLVCLAGEIGLDPGTAAAMLRGDLFKSEVEADERAVRGMGVSSVPFFLINSIPVHSAVPPEEFLSVLNRAWKTPQPAAAQLEAVPR
jgi:predicted DsbA family dithiol-disulfide isomerase